MYIYLINIYKINNVQFIKRGSEAKCLIDKVRKILTLEKSVPLKFPSLQIFLSHIFFYSTPNYLRCGF